MTKTIQEQAQEKIDENLNTNKVLMMVSAIEHKARVEMQLENATKAITSIENAKTINELHMINVGNNSAACYTAIGTSNR